jgi:transposase
MLSPGPASEIFLAAGPTDLRKSFDTLSALVRGRLGKDPLSGQFFVFCNSRHNRIKILFWDRTGFWVCAKRLERGTFDWPRVAEKSALSLQREQLAILLGGLEWQGMKRRAWYDHPAGKSE